MDRWRSLVGTHLCRGLLIVSRWLICDFVVEKPSELNFASVRESLMHIVPLCLDSDPSLIPQSCNPVTPRINNANAAVASSSSVGPFPSGSSHSVLDLEGPSLLDTTTPFGNKCLDTEPQTNAGLSSDPSTDADTGTGTATPNTPHTDTVSLHLEYGDPDDFTFWEEEQAKRICLAIEQVFGVEYAPEVVVADANLTALANRILLSKEILTG
jgi:phosphatidylethanolamine N-methyltransferase